MRNLKCIDSSTISNEDGIIGTSWDASTDSIVCLRVDSTLQLHLQRWNRKELLQIACWDGPEVGGFPLIDFHCFGDATACIVSGDGDIIHFKENTSCEEERIEIVGSIDAGISAATWSPDEDILAIATKASTLIFLTRDFEELANVTLSPQDLDVSDHVSVGWGKKETQFKGKNARALRDPTVPEIVDAGHLAEEYDHGETTISWRGDGAYVAVNSVESSNQRRVMRIYSREGILESVTEPVNGLLGALSWRPAGNLIAGVQNLEDQFNVVFFERNGLRHGQFDLRPQTKSFKNSFLSLQWNVDSTILAVCYKDRVQLWTMSNYHWYLKQDLISPPGEDAGDLMFKWHPEHPTRFLFSNSKGIQTYQYTFEVSASPISPPFDYGVVAVIDGQCLKVTPFRQANIPPPLSLYEIKLQENANDVCIILNNEHSESKKQSLEIKVLQLTRITKWLLNPSLSTPPEYLGEADPDKDIALYDSWRPLAFRRQSPLPGASRFHLTENGSLLDDQQVLARGCTSFLLTPSYLIFTTSQHLLKFVHLAPAGDLQIPPDTPESDERCRSIERGARLVTAMPSIFAILLQMPRGNLETIYPRALVLAGIRKDINDKKYENAFLACRTQRVDLNIIHDHNTKQFIDSVGLFIDQVKKVEHIDLFLSSLKEEDVSKTMYRGTLRTERLEQEVRVINGPSKVNRVCDTFLKALSSRKFNVKNMITAQVCKNPPELDAGLLEIVRLQEQGSDQVDETIEHICFLADVNRLFDNALGLYDLRLALLIAQQSQKDPREYVPFLQNFQRMEPLRRQYSIDDHLGRYKKALGNLHELDAFEELKNYVSKHALYAEALGLYRYKEAEYSSIMHLYAEHLKSASRFQEAATAFQYLGLSTEASESYRLANLWQESIACASLIPLPPDQLHSLAENLAQAATETKNFHAAATIYLDYLHDISSAARNFCKGYHFAAAFRTITLPTNQPHHQHLLESVFDASLADNMATMTDLLADCKAQLHAQVPRIRDLRLKKADDLLAFWEGDANGAKADVPDNVSLAPTDTSTAMGASLFTRYTGSVPGTLQTGTSRRSGKSRRREERKRARGKKGSIYEEEYLVSSVGRLVERVNGAREEVENLVLWLVRRKMVERARAVEGGMVDVVKLCEEAIAEVWGSVEEEEDGKKGVVGESENGGEGGGVQVPLVKRPEVVPFARQLFLLSPSQ